LFCKVNSVACTIGPSVNPLHKYRVNSTYGHYYARYIFDFWRFKYERKLYLNCMVNMFSLSVNTLLNWFYFFQKPNFSNLFEISVTKKFIIQYLMQLRSKKYETNSMKLESFKIFPIVARMHLDSDIFFHFDLIQLSLKILIYLNVTNFEKLNFFIFWIFVQF